MAPQVGGRELDLHRQVTAQSQNGGHLSWLGDPAWIRDDGKERGGVGGGKRAQGESEHAWHIQQPVTACDQHRAAGSAW